MQPKPMPMPMHEKKEQYQLEKSDFLEGNLCSLELIDSYEDEPAFYEVDGGVYIPKSNENSPSEIEGELTEAGLAPKIAKSIVDFIGNNKGGFFADILGFTPSTSGGGSGVVNINLLFGKLYIPTIPDFIVIISIANTETNKGDISIKLLGVGAGGSKEFVCKVTQIQKISSTPLDLVIPASYQVTKWEDSEGRCFYTHRALNVSRRILAKEAENPYENESGFEEIENMKGEVDRYDTSVLLAPMEASEELTENTKITLGAKFSPAPKFPTIDISGIATVNNQFKVLYSIPTGYQYVTFVEKKNNFQHLWAYKGDSATISP